MKQIMTISAALLFLTIGEVQAQNGIEQVLKNIETNNKELQANEQLITSQKLEAKTDNNLPDPTLSYAHQSVGCFSSGETVTGKRTLPGHYHASSAKAYFGGTSPQCGRTC